MKGMGRYCRGSAGEQGAVLVTALLLLVALAALGAGAVTLTSIDTLTTGNYKLATQGFYAAEAGTEEARARLRANAGANLIADPDQTSIDWRAYIGNATQATLLWPTTTQQYTPKDSLSEIVQAGLNYAVEIRHKTDADLAGTSNPPTTIVYWGDGNGNGFPSQNVLPIGQNIPITGRNVYVVTSYGSTSMATRELAIEVTRVPPITVPAALYVEAQTTVQGNSTFINGNDGCGTQNKPGVATVLDNAQVGSPPKDSVDLHSAHITGSPDIAYDWQNLDIQAVVNALKTAATVQPNPQSGTLTGGNWGTPTGGTQGSATGNTITQPTPSSCSTTNIVYFNTGGTQIKLAGVTSGCGILLVEGDLNLDGGFSWYGPVIVTGSVTYAGGGNKHLTGAILAGGSVNGDLLGGNANLVYCSTAISDQTQNLPLQILSWKEL